MALAARNSVLLPEGDHRKRVRKTGRRKLNLAAMGKEKNIDGDNLHHSLLCIVIHSKPTQGNKIP